MRLFLLAFAIVMSLTTAHAENWPHWRGPAATGVSGETGLPERWSDTENIAWKAPVRGLGISSPIVWGDQVFVTSQIGRSARRAGNHPTLVQGGNPADAGERALGGSAVGWVRKSCVSGHGAEPRRWTQAVGVRAAGGRTARRSPRQAQPRLVQSRHRRTTSVRVVRHGPDRRARHERQTRLVSASRPGVFAVRHQLGPQQLARDLQRLAVPHLLSRHGLVSAESRCRIRQDEVAHRSRRHVQLVQHAAGRAIRQRRTS